MKVEMILYNEQLLQYLFHVSHLHATRRVIFVLNVALFTTQIG